MRIFCTWHSVDRMDGVMAFGGMDRTTRNLGVDTVLELLVQGGNLMLNESVLNR